MGDKELEAVMDFRKAIRKPDERKAFVEGLYLIANSDDDCASSCNGGSLALRSSYSARHLVIFRICFCECFLYT